MSARDLAQLRAHLFREDDYIDTGDALNYIATLEDELARHGVDILSHRIEELKREWADATGDNPDDYALSGDDWAVGLGWAGADEITALLERVES